MLSGSGDRARSGSRDSNRSIRSRSPGMPGAEKRKPTPPLGCPDGACYGFFTTGTCKFPDCKFKHVAGPNAAAVESEPSAAAGRPPGRPSSATKPKPATDKSKACPHWAKGSCKLGDRCAWSHSGPGGAAAPATEDSVLPRNGGALLGDRGGRASRSRGWLRTRKRSFGAVRPRAPFTARRSCCPGV